MDLQTALAAESKGRVPAEAVVTEDLAPDQEAADIHVFQLDLRASFGDLGGSECQCHGHLPLWLDRKHTICTLSSVMQNNIQPCDLTAADIRAVRARLGETQTAFGLRFGVSRLTVAKWETGRPPERGSTYGLLIERVFAELETQS